MMLVFALNGDSGGLGGVPSHPIPRGEELSDFPPSQPPTIEGSRSSANNPRGDDMAKPLSLIVFFH
jgi:hypothetical protein